MTRRKMTPEEKKQSALKRKSEADAMLDRYPPLHIHSKNYECKFNMDGGDWVCAIRIQKSGQWQAVEGSHGDAAEQFLFRLSMEDCLNLIRALAARYNATADELNEIASKIKVPRLHPVPMDNDKVA